MCDPAVELYGNKQTRTKAESFMKMVPLKEENVAEAFDSPRVTRTRSFPNMFAANKTIAQGMMDIALITANANQLRYLLEYSRKSKSFYITFALIVISLILQVIVGVFLIFKGRQDFRGEKSEQTVRVNSCIVLGVFLITVINVFISAFSQFDSNV